MAANYRKLIIGIPSIIHKQLSIYQKAGFRVPEERKNFFLDYYSKPIFEEGVQFWDMTVLMKVIKKNLNRKVIPVFIIIEERE